MYYFKDAITKEDKKILNEQVNIFIQFIDTNKDESEIESYNITEDEIAEELKKMGIIRNNYEFEELNVFLKEELFNRLIKAVTMKISENIEDKFIERLYDKLKENYYCKNKYNLVDLFCGAGGMSLGFSQEGIIPIFANDIDRTCVETYKFNHPYLHKENIVCGDLVEIVDNLDKYEILNDEIDYIIGGPPCQGFSSANKQRIIDDPRNQLYKYFLKTVAKLQPKIVVMENVKGMLNVANQVVEDFDTIVDEVNPYGQKYLVSYQVLNSFDFSVAQKRERLIYIGIRKDVVSKVGIFPEECFKNLNLEDNKKFVFADATYGLPSLSAQKEKNKNEIDSEFTGYKIKREKNMSVNEYIQMINNNDKTPYLFNHKARYLNDNNYEIYKLMKPGDDGTAPQIQDIYRYSHRNHCFKDRYYKMFKNRPARTITAHLKMDGHSHIHPEQIRSITPREAARLQSFPDSYFFLGLYLDTFRQIGNAVPPLMARHIAKELNIILEKYYEKS